VSEKRIESRQCNSGYNLSSVQQASSFRSLRLCLDVKEIAKREILKREIREKRDTRETK
jgi:hypothetical protein